MPRSEESSNQSGACSSSLQARTHLRPVARRDLAFAQLVAGDARAAGDEALGELDLGHLEREEGDRLVPLDRHVFGDVRDQRALPHRRAGGDDDQVAGLEAAGHRVDVAEAGGGAGHLGLAGRELLQPVDLVVQDVAEDAEVGGLLFVGDFEEEFLGPLGELARFAVALVDPALDFLAGAEQPAQQRILLDDLGVVFGVAGGGDFGGQLGDVVFAARFVDLVGLRQRLGDGELVDRLRGGVEVVDRFEDRPVAVEVEVVGVQLHLVDHPGQGRLGDQHRAEDGLLRLDVLRGDVGGRGRRHGSQR